MEKMTKIQEYTYDFDLYSHNVIRCDIITVNVKWNVADMH